LRTTARYALRVVGVADDVPSRTIADGPSMVAYLPNLYRPLGDSAAGAVQLSGPRSQVYVVRTSLPPLSLVRPIRRTIDEVDPKLVMARIGTLEDLVAGASPAPGDHAALARERWHRSSLGWWAFLGSSPTPCASGASSSGSARHWGRARKGSSDNRKGSSDNLIG
jgi:hypothetical protein